MVLIEQKILTKIKVKHKSKFVNSAGLSRKNCLLNFIKKLSNWVKSAFKNKKL